MSSKKRQSISKQLAEVDFEISFWRFDFQNFESGRQLGRILSDLESEHQNRQISKFRFLKFPVLKIEDRPENRYLRQKLTLKHYFPVTNVIFASKNREISIAESITW